MSCRCPADSFPPRLPTAVAYPSGSPEMNVCAPIARAAASISSSVAAGRPSLMFCATEPSNRKDSCVISTISARSSSSGSSRRSTPSSSTRPALGS